MLSIFRSIFGRNPEGQDGVDKELLRLAIERVIDGTDPRLRAVSGCRKRLTPAVIQAVEHTLKLVGDLPPPIELSRKAFSSDERIRAFFASPERIREFLSGSQALHDCLEKRAGLDPEYIHGLLLVVRNERNVLGMELDGEIVRRDVPQVSISFGNPRLVGMAESESASRQKDQKRVFDFFIELALRNMIAIRTKEGESRQRRELLARKLRALESANWGIEGLLNQEREHTVDARQLEQEIAGLEAELEGAETAPVTLDRYLDAISQTLSTAPELLQRSTITVTMDRMGKKIEQSADASAITLELDEFSASDGRRLIALPIYIPFAEIPERPDFLSEASRYL